MGVRPVLIAPAVLLIAACSGSASPPAAGGDGETVTGSEHIGWDQPAADAGELATFRYAIYVDESRTERPDASCASSSAGGRFTCSTSLPEMTPGAHALQVAAFVLDGGVVRESSRSATVRVVKQ